MILIELFDRKDDLGEVIPLSQEFHAFKVIGGRRIRFSGGLSSSGLWEVEFAEVTENDAYGSERETASKHHMTGGGHEFEIMSFVMSCFKRFIDKYNPKRIEFSARSDEESRISLYRRMLKRFAKDYIVREFDVRLGRKMYTNFDLIYRDNVSITESMMKRSDPYTSGEREGARPSPIKTAHQTKIQNMAAKAGVPVSKVRAIWDDVKQRVDMKLPNAWAIIMFRVQRELGLREELINESKKFTDENGKVVYNWKSAKELNDEEDNAGYVPAEYTKILELGEIYANEPGKGQGDQLMKRFLSSSEAKKAELIFLDPVPGLGKNFKSARSEEQQVSDLVRFYKRYGFRHNPESATKRMWLVKKGEIPDDQLPT